MATNIVLEQDHGKFYVDGNEVSEEEFNEVSLKVYDMASARNNSRLVVKLKIEDETDFESGQV